MSAAVPVKRVLCHCNSQPQFTRLLASLTAAAEHRHAPDVVEDHGVTFQWIARPSSAALLDDLRAQYVNLVLLDLRGDGDGPVVDATSAFAVLDALDRVEDVERRFAFDRILALLPATGSSDVDRTLLRLGARGVRHVLRAPPADTPDRERVLADAILAEARSILGRRRSGPHALCASGGGITGIYFELGALKCLDDCLADSGGVNAFDMFFGISAGAVVSGPLAVGYTVDELMAGIARVPGGRVGPIDLRLFRVDNLDPGLLGRARRAARSVAEGLWRGAVARRRGPVDEERRFDLSDLVAAPFRADRFERRLRQMLTGPGASNDFEDLTRELFIGATDQDGRTHVVFGGEGHRDVPISVAIQASLSLNPAFTATRIGGRYYEDGAITRTSNFVEAIRRGASLLVVIDPLVPYVARTRGFANQRGVLYNIDQDIRTISYTRYEATRNWVLRQHPEVSSYTIVPANRHRRLMSINPMDHRPYLEIWRGGYLSTFHQLRRVGHRLAGDLAARQRGFDLARAEQVAARLERVDTPSFADFFPDRRVILRQGPLCLESPASRPNDERAA